MKEVDPKYWTRDGKKLTPRQRRYRMLLEMRKARTIALARAEVIRQLEAELVCMRERIEEYKRQLRAD
jgi:hypothetical protein